MNFYEVSCRFLSHLALAKGVSEHTIRGYRLDLNSFLAFAKTEIGGELAFDGVSKRLVRRYLSHLYEAKASTRTVLRRLSALRSFYRYAIKEKLVSENPLEEIDSPKKE